MKTAWNTNVFFTATLIEYPRGCFHVLFLLLRVSGARDFASEMVSAFNRAFYLNRVLIKYFY